MSNQPLLEKLQLKDEKNNIIAFDSGYTKSRTAIIDANITFSDN